MNKKSILLGLTLALVGCLPMGTSLAADTPHFKNNKAAAEYFWNEVFNKHDTAVIDTMVGPKYKQHSPEFADGKQAFKDGVTGFLKAHPDSSAVIKHIGADGDLVFIHNHIKLNKEDRGQAAVDIFRIKDGKNRRTLGCHPGYPGKSSQRQYDVLDFFKRALSHQGSASSLAKKAIDPAVDALHDIDQLFPSVGQAVFDSRRHRGMDVPPDQVVALEDVEVLRQHFGTDARQAPLQIGEEHRSICQGQ